MQIDNEHICGVIVSVIVSNEVHRGSNPSGVKLKTIKLVFGASLLRVQE